MRKIYVCTLILAFFLSGCSFISGLFESDSDKKTITTSTKKPETRTAPPKKSKKKAGFWNRVSKWRAKRKARKEAKRIAHLKHLEAKMQERIASLKDKEEIQRLRLENAKLLWKKQSSPQVPMTTATGKSKGVDKVVDWAADHLTLLGLIAAGFFGFLAAFIKFIADRKGETT